MADPNPSDILYINPEPLRVANPEGSVPVKPTPPEAFPVVTDFRVEPVPDMSGHFGVQMRWVSDSHGVVAVFPWWDHLERELRSYVPDGMPIGSRVEPFVDMAMNWGIKVWRDGDYIYVVHDGGTGWNTWYRVPAQTFVAAWEDGLRSIKATYAPSPANETIIASFLPGSALVVSGVVTAAAGALAFPTQLALLVPAGVLQLGLGLATRRRSALASGLLATVVALPSFLIGLALLTRFPLFGVSWTLSGLGPAIAGALVGAGAAPAIVTLISLARPSPDLDAKGVSRGGASRGGDKR